jgi:hypothetical protein
MISDTATLRSAVSWSHSRRNIIILSVHKIIYRTYVYCLPKRIVLIIVPIPTYLPTYMHIDGDTTKSTQVVAGNLKESRVVYQSWCDFLEFESIHNNTIVAAEFLFLVSQPNRQAETSHKGCSGWTWAASIEAWSSSFHSRSSFKGIRFPRRWCR